MPAAFVNGKPQHLLALEHANAIRLARADVKRQLRAGELQLRAALTAEACATARVADVLLAIPRLGPIKVGKLLARADVPATKLCGGLTDRQLERVLAAAGGEELPLAWPSCDIAGCEHEEADEGLFVAA